MSKYKYFNRLALLIIIRQHMCALCVTKRCHFYIYFFRFIDALSLNDVVVLFEMHKVTLFRTFTNEQECFYRLTQSYFCKSSITSSVYSK